ncbi:hypothetical protein V5799_012198, partial [Amblyomma americanum]
MPPLLLIQVLLLGFADENDTCYNHTHLPVSTDTTFTDRPVHDTARLIRPPAGHFAWEVTSSSTTGIRADPQRFDFIGHGGPHVKLALSMPPLLLIQVLLLGFADENDTCYNHTRLPVSTDTTFTDRPVHDTARLIRPPAGHFAWEVTSSSTTGIRADPQRFDFIGHGGPHEKLALSMLPLLLIQVLLLGFADENDTCYNHTHLPVSTDTTFTDRPVHDTARLIRPPAGHFGWEVTSSSTTGIRADPQRFDFIGHGGPHEKLALSMPPLLLIQVLLLGFADENDTCYNHTRLPVSTDTTFTDRPVHDTARLIRPPAGHFAWEVTSSSTTGIRADPQRFDFIGHGGPHVKLALSMPPLLLIQVLLLGFADENDTCYNHTRLPVSTDTTFTDRPVHDTARLIRPPAGHFAWEVTSSSTTGIRADPQRFDFIGHGGPHVKLALSMPPLLLIQVLLLGFADENDTCYNHTRLPVSTDTTFTDRPVHDTARLIRPPAGHFGWEVTSSSTTGIRADPQRFDFIGHGGPHEKLALSMPPLLLIQVLLLGFADENDTCYNHTRLPVSTDTTFTDRPVHDTARLIRPPAGHFAWEVTSSSTTGIRADPQRFDFIGHGGPHVKLALSMPPLLLIQVLLLGFADENDTCYNHTHLPVSTDTTFTDRPVHDTARLIRPPAGHFAWEVTSSSTTGIRADPQRFDFIGHGGPHEKLALSMPPLLLIQVLLLGFADENDTCYNHTRLPVSTDTTFTDRPVHDTARLIRPPAGHFAWEVTSSSTTGIRADPQRFDFIGHGGPHVKLALSMPPLLLIQVLLLGFADENDTCYNHTRLPVSTDTTFTDRPVHDTARLIRPPAGHFAWEVTSSSTTGIRADPQRFDFIGHGGPHEKLALSMPPLLLIQVLLLGFADENDTCYNHTHLPVSTDTTFTDRPVHDTARLIRPPAGHFAWEVTSSSTTGIRADPQRFDFIGHGGPHVKLALSMPPLLLIQVLLLGFADENDTCYNHTRLPVSTDTTFTDRPVHDTARLIRPPAGHFAWEVTSSSTTGIRADPQRFDFIGHGGPHVKLALSMPPLLLIQVLLLGFADENDTCYNHTRLPVSTDTTFTDRPVHDTARLIRPPAGHFAWEVTSSSTTGIRADPQRFDFIGHGGPHEKLALSMLPLLLIQVLLLGFADENDTCYNHTHLPVSTDTTFTDRPVHDTARLIRPPAGHFGWEVTSSSTTGIRADPQRFDFIGHGGPHEKLALSMPPLLLIQVLLLGFADENDTCYNHTRLPVSTDTTFTDRPVHDTARLIRPPAGHFAWEVTSSSTTGIRAGPQRFDFIGHGGPHEKLALSMPPLLLIQVLLLGFADENDTCYNHTRLPVSTDTTFTDRPVHDTARLIRPPAGHFAWEVTSSSTTGIRADPQRFDFIRHGGPHEKLALSMPPLLLIQVLLLGFADENDTCYNHTHLPVSTDTTFTDRPVHDTARLIRPPAGHFAWEVTSSSTTGIRADPQRFDFIGHGGPHEKLALSMPPLLLIQVLLLGFADENDTCYNHTRLPVSTDTTFTDRPVHDTARLIRPPAGHFAWEVTSSSTTGIRADPQRFDFIGHGGPHEKLALSMPPLLLIQVLLLGFADENDTCYNHTHLPVSTDTTFTDRPVHDTARLIRPPAGHFAWEVTSSSTTGIRADPQRFDFIGHGGPHEKLALSMPPLLLIQVLLLGFADENDTCYNHTRLPVSTDTTFTDRPVHDTARLIRPPAGHFGWEVTSSSTTGIRADPQRFDFIGHGGPHEKLALSMPPLLLIQVLLLGFADENDTCYNHTRLPVSTDTTFTDRPVHDTARLIRPPAGHFAWEVTSSSTTGIRADPQRFDFIGHGGPHEKLALSMPPLLLIQVLLLGFADENDTCYNHTRLPVSTDTTFTDRPVHDTARLIRPPAGHFAWEVTSSSTTGIRADPQRFDFIGHGGPHEKLALSMPPLLLIQVLLLGFADENDTCYNHTRLPVSTDTTFTDRPVHDTARLIRPPAGHFAWEVTSSSTTGIRADPQRFDFIGHGGPHEKLALSMPPLLLIQVLLLGFADENDTCYNHTRLPVSTDTTFTDRPVHDTARLIRPPAGHFAWEVTSSSTTGIRADPQRFDFIGHGGPHEKLALSMPPLLLIQVLLLGFADENDTCYNHTRLPVSTDTTFTDRPVHDTARLIRPPAGHFAWEVTSSSTTGIRADPQRFDFIGHGGPHEKLALSMPPLLLIQVLLLGFADENDTCYNHTRLPVSTDTTFTDRPVHDTARLIRPPAGHFGWEVTSSSTTGIRADPQRFDFTGHGGPHEKLALSMPPLLLIQ